MPQHEGADGNGDAAVGDSDASRSIRGKVAEWIRRYLPWEITSTAGELGGAACAYLATGSVAAASVAATVGAVAGWYVAAYTSAVRSFYRAHNSRPFAARVLVATLLAARSMSIEFGPAEFVDGLLVRPLAFYMGPHLFGNVIAGWIVGKLVSDIAFYVCTIASYERFKALLAPGRPNVEEVGHGPHCTCVAA